MFYSHVGTTVDDRIAERVRAADFTTWRQKVIAAGGCAHPIHLSGQWSVTDNATGQTLARRSGHILVPCGTRRAAVCRPCADRYAADAFHLVRAGLVGGKGVPETVTHTPRYFVTLTAPSFGPVHQARTSRNGKSIPCGCGGYHHPQDSRIGTPLDPESYDYGAAVLWQAHATQLWHRFVGRLRRTLARLLGIPESHFPRHARLSYAKVAEYQRRGMVHFHAVIRVDGPTGPTDPTPAGINTESLAQAIRQAADTTRVDTCRPDGVVLGLTWGRQLDLRPIRAEAAGDFEDGDGEISEARLAGYVAKYATKSSGATDHGDRRVHSQRHIDQLRISDHHRAMIQTAWDLGGLAMYARLNLRRWAHMLGFGGHFLTKSRAYSTTFTDIRRTQANYRTAEALAELGVTEDQVTVVNHWDFTGIGYRDDAERELASAIAERLQHHSKPRGDHDGQAMGH
ncbi:plasmid replication initiator protein [Longimycelium tulufanense]|uniref:Plasmid replication initiator protein n=1 Tax=Longimycelium tulufanense TaxID=907463 RepID=A0A8J3CJP0_9PSEU|nr:replication initiator [Longimycelium tulufanense]GGM72667.1 plasmid replication initiator protein [Longimycelium tulufanense]